MKKTIVTPEQANNLVSAMARKCIDTLLNDIYLRRATAYISPKCTVKATRQAKFDGRDKRETFIVTYGIPNYLERHFIKECLDAGETFPIKRIQLQRYPKK